MQYFIDLIKQFDEPIFFFINQSIKIKQLDLIFPIITRLAEPITFVSLCVILFFLGKYRAKLTSVLILLATYATYITTLTLKEIINRPRPLDAYLDISVMGSVKLSSFPSTHSALIAAIVTLLCFKYKKSSFILLPIALAVGVSRIYLGHHYPSDVIAGFALGFLVAVLFLGIEKLIEDIQNL
ncbi:MAG: phosphatase PAP2 family protein [Candidatus Omnitrophota bacterium]